MLIRVDKYFIDELKKNNYDIDFKTLTEIYRDSRKNPEVVKKRKWQEIKKSGVKGSYKWVEEEQEWIEVLEEEQER